MCTWLVVASPLTATELRAMLPPGLAADPLPPAALPGLRRLLPAARTLAVLRRGACACDFFLEREGGADERHLRRRYALLGVHRALRHTALERHRRHPAPGTPAAWSRALATLVREHARTAGDAAFLRLFAADDPLRETIPPLALAPAVERRAADLPALAGDWLADAVPVIVRA